MNETNLALMRETQNRVAYCELDIGQKFYDKNMKEYVKCNYAMALPEGAEGRLCDFVYFDENDIVFKDWIR